MFPIAKNLRSKVLNKCQNRLPPLFCAYEAQSSCIVQVFPNISVYRYISEIRTILMRFSSQEHPPKLSGQLLSFYVEHRITIDSLT